MSVIPCFFLKPSDQVEVILRRHCRGSESHYHDREVVIGKEPKTVDQVSYELETLDHSDPRWPATCNCGHSFQDEDNWETLAVALFQRSDTGELVTTQEAPPGAMWYAPWYGKYMGPDGQTLIVKTPAGNWLVDYPSSSGGHWTRTGTPPNITANPSIGFHRLNGKGFEYHGWLKEGQLIEC